MTWIYPLIIAFSMYSSFPMPKSEWDSENMRYVMCFFPLIGLAIGIIVYIWLWVSNALSIGNVLTAAVATVLPVWLTGGIHLDGFCDTSDALASNAPMERKLEILKDSNTGAFALIKCCVYFILYFGLWSEYEFSTHSAVVLLFGFFISRSLSALALLQFRCARKNGLAATFADAAAKRNTKNVLMVFLIASGAFLLLYAPIPGAFALSAAMLTFGYYRFMSYRKFGGITGDLAGYFLQLCELAILAAVVIAGRFL